MLYVLWKKKKQQNKPKLNIWRLQSKDNESDSFPLSPLDILQFYFNNSN